MKTKQAILSAAFVILALSVVRTSAEETAKPVNAVQVVTSAHNYEEMDRLSQALIQLCLKEECQAQKAVLERLAPSYASVGFVQMSTSDNSEFANRIIKEQVETLEAQRNVFSRYWRAFLRYMGWGGELEAIHYPIYVFKGSDLNVAPDIATAEQLKQFIDWNASYAKED